MPTIEELTAKVEAAEAWKAKAEKAESELKSLRETPSLSGIRKDDEGRVTGYWEDSSAEEITVVSGYEGRGQRAVKSKSRANMKALQRQGYRPFSEFKSFGEFIKFGVENRGVGDRHKIESRVGSHLKAIQGLTTTDGSDGGFTIMPEYNHLILEHSFGNNLWQETDNYNVSGNSMTFLANAETSRANGSRAGGMQGYWVGEGNTITKSKPTLREVNLKLGKIAVVVYLTDELLQDNAFALEQYVTRKAGQEFAFLQGDALINGIAIGGQPLGWMNSPNLVSVAKETGQDAATIQTINIEKMYARFFAPFLPNAKFYHHQDIQPQLDTMTLGLGLGQVPVYLPPGNMSAAPYGVLKGRPLQPTEFNATLGTQGDIMLADMGQMLSINKGGIQQAVSMHVEFLTDQTALRFTMRCGARPWENAPITPYKGSNTQTSCVVLDTRS